MRNKTLGLAAALVASAMLAPAAHATVDVTAEIYKNKDITVTENITVTKEVFLNVEVIPVLDRAAEAMAIHNATNTNNTTTRTPVTAHATVEGNDGITRTATIVGSVGAAANQASGNTGVIGVNQDVGDNTNQGIVVAVGATRGGDTVADAQADAEQVNTNNSVFWGPYNQSPPFGLIEPISVTATIQGSISHNIGVVGVNQNAGNNNNQTEALAVAVGLPGGTGGAVALAEADLGQTNTGNIVNEVKTAKTATIGRSIYDNQGIVGVNQSAGNNANQANVVSISATLAP